MKMSVLIEKTAETKVAAKAQQLKDGYKTVLKILNNDLQGAEMLPGGTLKLTVAAVVGDEFDAAIKSIGNDTLNVGGITLWRSTTSRGVINVDGINPSEVDEYWDTLIDEIDDRIEMF